MATMASVLSLMEEVARIQRETAEVLHALAARSGNGPAVQRLKRAEDASLNTVKSHTRAIYRKLGISNRHDAIRRGRELAILPS